MSGFSSSRRSMVDQSKRSCTCSLCLAGQLHSKILYDFDICSASTLGGLQHFIVSCTISSLSTLMLHAHAHASCFYRELPFDAEVCLIPKCCATGRIITSVGTAEVPAKHMLNGLEMLYRASAVKLTLWLDFLDTVFAWQAPQQRQAAPLADLFRIHLPSGSQCLLSSRPPWPDWLLQICFWIGSCRAPLMWLHTQSLSSLTGIATCMCKVRTELKAGFQAN